jgi:hypothetical protein
MRKLILATAATAGLVAATAMGASAAPVIGSVANPESAAQQGQHPMVTNVQYEEYHHWHHHWHHRHWEHGHWYYH